MDEKTLNDIRARLALAVPGPWKVGDGDDNGDEWIEIPGHDLFFGNIEDTDKCCYDNARFIVHAREDIPALLEYIDELRGKLYHAEQFKNGVQEDTRMATIWEELDELEA